MSKSKITQIGQAIVDLIEAWQIAKDSSYVQKPISYALYYTWRKWDKQEQARKVEAGNNN